MARGNNRIYEIGISYYGRTYAEGKKIGWKDGFRAIYAILNIMSGIDNIIPLTDSEAFDSAHPLAAKAVYWFDKETEILRSQIR